MRKRIVWVALALAGLAGSAATSPVQAHHSFPATYEVAKVVTLEGTVTAFLYRNPHSFVHVEGKDEKGEIVTWSIEWGAGGQLSQQGVQRDSLKPGDSVIIQGNPSRDTTSHRLLMKEIVRPKDGWRWGGVFA